MSSEIFILLRLQQELTLFLFIQALRTSIKNAVNGLNLALKDKNTQLEVDIESLYKNEIATAEKLTTRIQTGKILFLKTAGAY